MLATPLALSQCSEQAKGTGTEELPNGLLLKHCYVWLQMRDTTISELRRFMAQQLELIEVRTGG